MSPLILAPSFDDKTREEVEDHLAMVRIHRLEAALEFQQSKLLKLDKEGGSLQGKLARRYEQLGKALERLDKEAGNVDKYLNDCLMIRSELDLVLERIALAKR
jgi:hypothetical protein